MCARVEFSERVIRLSNAQGLFCHQRAQSGGIEPLQAAPRASTLPSHATTFSGHVAIKRRV